MSDQESRRAEREARHDVAARPTQSAKHEHVLNRYLGSVYYEEVQAHREQAAAGPRPASEDMQAASHPGAAGLVVVGVDESASGFAAADQASIEAGLRGWALHVIHVQPPVRSRAFTEARDRGSNLLARIARRARAQPTDVPVTTELCVGSPADLLVERSAGAGLLVVGSRGLNTLASLVAGSISSQVSAHATTPVLVVRVPSMPSDPDSPPPGVVVGVDGSVESDAAAAFAAEEARLRGVALTAIRVTAEVPTYGGSGRPDPLTAGALDPTLGSVIGLTVHRRPVDGDARETLIEASTRAGAVVVGARGSGGVRGVRLGSTSQALIRHAHCPVFVIHPPTRAESAATAS
jgi:nucleotide-binding universal stress UspA family protein